MPFALSERVMNALKADPRTIDLRALAPHFYNLSERILELFEEEEMVDVLSNVSTCPVSFYTYMQSQQTELIETDVPETSRRDRRPRA